MVPVLKGDLLSSVFQSEEETGIVECGWCRRRRGLRWESAMDECYLTQVTLLAPGGLCSLLQTRFLENYHSQYRIRDVWIEVRVLCCGSWGNNSALCLSFCGSRSSVSINTLKGFSRCRISSLWAHVAKTSVESLYLSRRSRVHGRRTRH